MKTTAPIPALQHQCGVTLIEACVAMAVLATIATAVAPSFAGTVARRKVEGLARQFETDVHYARSAAVAGNRPLRMSFVNNAAGSCYVVHTGDAGQCACTSQGTAQCEGDARALKATFVPAGEAVLLQSNVSSMLFDPVRGTTSPSGTVKFSSERVGAIHTIVNIMGRVRSCSPAPTLPGHKAC